MGCAECLTAAHRSSPSLIALQPYSPHLQPYSPHHTCYGHTQVFGGAKEATAILVAALHLDNPVARSQPPNGRVELPPPRLLRRPGNRVELPGGGGKKGSPGAPLFGTRLR